MKKIAIASFVGYASALNIAGLINDGVQTVQDASNGHADLGSLINDGTNIVNDATGSNVPDFGSAIDQGVTALGGDPNLNDVANDAQDLWNGQFINVQGLLKDGINAFQDAKKNHGKVNIGKLIADGLKIAGDLKSSGAAHQNSEQEFVNVAGLINDGVQAINDVKNGGDIGSLINDGTSAYNDATGQSVPQLGQAVDSGISALGGDAKISDLINDAKTIIGGADNGETELLNLGGLIQDGIAAVKDIKDTKKDGKKDALQNLGKLVQDGLKIAGDIKSSNGATQQNSEQELFNFGGLIQDGLQAAKDVKNAKKGGKKNAMKNLGQLLKDGLKLAGDMKGSNSASQNSEQEFVNVAGLINDGVQAVTDIKNGGDIGNLVNDATNAINDATGKNIPQLGQAVDAGIKAFGGDTNGADLVNDAKNLLSNNEFAFVRRFRGGAF